MNENLNTQPKNYQLTKKLIVLALLIGISWIATMFVWGVVQEREANQRGTTNLVSEQWSRPQIIVGPVLTIPVETANITTTGEHVIDKSTITLLPQNLSYESDIKTETLKRGIYTTPVYTTAIDGSGSFDLTDINQNIPVDTRILWDKAVLSINVSDPRGISSVFDLDLNHQTYQMLPASEFPLLNRSGVHTNISIDPNQLNQSFSFSFPIKGSQEISFLPLGENTDVTIKSDWAAPSFTGEFLPESREISENGFMATWKISSYSKNLPQSWSSDDTTLDSNTLLTKAFGVGLYQEVSFYTMIDRSIKYSILFICLTFLTFFMYELLAGLRIHPMQYLLVGLSIALFYLLLLSLAEIIGFLPAYLASTIATTLLITGYCFSVLKAKKRAFSITAILIALYGYLYILLQLEQFSLLFGSVLLFSVLATVMYITRNLDWYTLNNRE
jgi:inner membrane protein